MEGTLAIATGVVGALTGALGAWLALRKDRREARSQVVEEAGKTIALLQEQNELLKQQQAQTEESHKASIQAWREREKGWQRAEEKLERRIDDIDRAYRELVNTVTAMGLCANAAACPNYSPGDRRKQSPAI